MTGIRGKVVEVGYESSESGGSRVHYALVKIRVSRSRSPKKAEEKLRKFRGQLLRRTVSIFPLTEATE